MFLIGVAKFIAAVFFVWKGLWILTDAPGEKGTDGMPLHVCWTTEVAAYLLMLLGLLLFVDLTLA